MDASEIYSKRLNAKEVIFLKENGKFIFPVADGRFKFSGGDQELRTSPLIREHPIRGESRRDFLGESEAPPQDSLPDAGEARKDFWSMSGSFIYRHHVVKLYSPREESFPIPLKYIGVSRTTQVQIWMSSKNDASMIIGILMGQEICLILGQVSLNLLYSKKHLLTDNMWSGERLTRKKDDIQARSFMARSLGENGKECQAEGEAKSGHMKNLNSITLENCEEFISLTLKTRNSRRPSRMLARNWKHQGLPPCLARSARTIRIVGMVINPIRSNQNLREFWKPVNPQDCVWENLYRIIIKTILQEKETIHCSITIWFTNLLLCPKP